MRTLSLFTRASGAAAALVCLIPCAFAGSLDLSGASLFGTDGTGAQNASNLWNTSADLPFNLWLKQGGNWVNTTFDPSVSLQLTPGTYTFAIFGQPAFSSQRYAGLNLFFGGNGAAPGISAFIPENSFSGTGANLTADSKSGFQVSGFGTAKGSGSLSFKSGYDTATLTGFSWYDPTVAPNANDKVTSGAGDYVGAYTNFPILPSNDYRGYFTLSVTETPEPGYFLSTAVSMLLLAVIAMRFRTRSSQVSSATSR